MRDSGFTRQERTFIAIMRVWVFAFLAAAVVFSLAPEVFLNYLNDIGRVFFGWESTKIEASEHFWLVLAVAYLLILAYASIVSQAKPLRNTGYARIVILGKLASSAGFAALLLLGNKQFYYLAGAIVDGLIFAITWRIYARASRSRN